MTETTNWPSLDQDDRLVWTCNGCGRPIEDRTGWVEVDHRAAWHQEMEQDRQRFERRQPGDDQGFSSTTLGDILSVGDVQWLAYHENCDPDPERDTYWIAVERLRTPRQILHWTAHLAEKTWVAETNWLEIVGRLGTPS